MKIVCPKCNNIQEVDDGALNVTCEKCGQTSDMDLAKQYTAQKYKEYQNLGYNNLYLSLDFNAAWENYSKALEIKENDLSSIMGLCLTKTSMSTFDHTYFDQVETIINKYDVYLNLENTFLFLNFIGDMLDQINFYFNELDYRCKFDETFINKGIFDEYVKTTKDIKNLMNYLTSTFEIMDQKELATFKEEHEEFMNRIESRMNDLELRLNFTYNVNHFGDIEVKDGEVTILGENKKDFEKDEIENMNMVVKNDKGVKIKKIFWPLIGVFLVLTTIFFIVFMTTKQNLYAYIFGGSLAVTGGLYLAYRILFKKTLR